MDMNQIRQIKNQQDNQFLYLGRWVNKEHFRAFVYNDKHEQKLANSYQEFESLTQSGVWFASKPASLPKRKAKDGISSSDGK